MFSICIYVDHVAQDSATLQKVVIFFMSWCLFRHFTLIKKCSPKDISSVKKSVMKIVEDIFKCTFTMHLDPVPSLNN